MRVEATVTETLITRDGAYFEYDKNVLSLFVPCTPSPKGSARAVQIPVKGSRKCPTCKQQPSRMAFIMGSADSTKNKQVEQESLMRRAVVEVIRAYPKFEPFNGPTHVEMHFIFEAPKARAKELFHTTYPDRDKLERMAMDCLTPPRRNKAPDFDAPHLLVNDSMACSGRSTKWWLHSYFRAGEVMHSFKPCEWVSQPGIFVQLSRLY